MPLVDMFSHINALKPWNPNHEIMSGLVHVNLPDFGRQAFREAMANAFCDPSSPLSNGIVGKVGRSEPPWFDQEISYRKGDWLMPVSLFL